MSFQVKNIIWGEGPGPSPNLSPWEGLFGEGYSLPTSPRASQLSLLDPSLRPQNSSQIYATGDTDNDTQYQM